MWVAERTSVTIAHRIISLVPLIGDLILSTLTNSIATLLRKTL